MLHASSQASFPPTSELTHRPEGRVTRMDTPSKVPHSHFAVALRGPLYRRSHRVCGSAGLVAANCSPASLTVDIRSLRPLVARSPHAAQAPARLLIDCLADEFDLFPTPTSDHTTTVIGTTMAALSAYAHGTAHEKKTRRPLLSSAPPTTGMFVWMELYFGNIRMGQMRKTAR